MNLEIVIALMVPAALALMVFIAYLSHKEK